MMDKRNNKIGVIALILFSGITQAKSAPNYKQLMLMNLGDILNVDVATGTPKQLSEAPAVISVITAQDIHITGARTLAEAVERVPGLHVMLSSFRFANNFSVRGIQTTSTPQVLILMDGVKISEVSQTANPASFRLPTNFIERIEVIRGSGSAVYGADAFSGVVNIITKPAVAGNEVTVGGKLGSFGYKEFWLNANTEINNLHMAFSFTHETQGNDEERTTPYGVLKRDRSLNNLHLNLQYGNFSMKNWYWDIKQYLGAGLSTWANENDKDNIKAYVSQLSWDKQLTNDLQANVNFSYNFQRLNAYFEIFPAGTYPVGNDGNLFTGSTLVSFPNAVIGSPKSDKERISFSSPWIFSGIEQHRLRVEVGIEQEKQKNVKEIKNFGPGVLDTANLPDNLVSATLVDVTGTPYVYSPDYERDLWFISIQDEWKFSKDWELTAGLRFDDYSDVGSTTNPRLALVWSTSESLTSKLLYSTAFRAPKVSELAYINNPASIGNPDIKPENIQTTELAFDYRPTKSLSGLLNLFTYQAEELINVDENGLYQNTGEQEGYGIEVEAKWQATDLLQISGNLSWLAAELPLTDEDKSQVPGLMSYLDIRYQIDQAWTLTSQAYYISDRTRETGDIRSAIDNYTKVDLTLSWQANSIWTAQLGVKNLFDEDIRSPSPNSGLFGAGLGFPDDYPMNSRNIYASVNITF